eukprot:2220513-Alexandrium_andersonii.AAC.1
MQVKSVQLGFGPYVGRATFRGHGLTLPGGALGHREQTTTQRLAMDEDASTKQCGAPQSRAPGYPVRAISVM